MNMKKMEKVDISQVYADPEQPRQEFDPSTMHRLEESVKKQGILVPLTVEKQDKGYMIIDGERRFRTATKLGLKTLPIIIHDGMDAFDRMVMRFHLQEQHTNWSSFDKARAIGSIKSSTGMSDIDIASTLGLVPTTVKGYLSLLSLSSRTMQMSVDKRIPFTHLRGVAAAVCGVEAPATRRALETALIDKVIAGVIENQTDISKYKKAIQSDNEKVITQIIKNPDYTSKEALVEAGIFGDTQVRTILNNSSWLNGVIMKANELGYNKGLDAAGEATLVKLMKNVQEFVDSAGYISK